MDTWKKAFWLAKFELKASFFNLFLCWFLLSFFALMFFMNFDRYVEDNHIGFDIFMLLMFSVAPYWFRSKHFQYKKISDGLYASPSFLMLVQLPIPNKILSKSRFIIYLAYLLPFILTTYPVLYIIYPSIRSVMDLPSYIVFVLFWILFGLFAGIILPASDAGNYVTSKTIFYSIITTLAIFIGIILLFYNVLGYGMVTWSIILAQNRPLITITISLILTVLSWTYWLYHMTKTMKKIDYM